MIVFFVFFFFNDTATTEIYTLSLHDALPILIWLTISEMGNLACTISMMLSLVRTESAGATGGAGAGAGATGAGAGVWATAGGAGLGRFIHHHPPAAEAANTTPMPATPNRRAFGKPRRTAESGTGAVGGGGIVLVKVEEGGSERREVPESH